MAKEFYNNLISFINNNDTTNANNLLMSELGKDLVHNRADFIELLNGSGVPAGANMADSELVTLFIANVQENKQLMLGSAFLINSRHKLVSFDGNDEISDAGVKVSYKVMDDYFNAEGYFEAEGEKEKHHNAGGLLGGIIGGVTQLAGKGMDAYGEKKMGSSRALAKQQDARQQMMQAVIEQRKSKQANVQKEADRKHKTNKMMMIVGGSLLGLILIGTIIYFVKKGKK